jgi:hypothetical protein
MFDFPVLFERYPCMWAVGWKTRALGSSKLPLVTGFTEGKKET